jgi:recombination protein RecA
MSSTLYELRKKLQSHLVKPCETHISTGLSTGLTDLDHFLLWSGVPKGHLSLFYGMRGMGATSMWVNMAAAATRSGRWVAWIETPQLSLCPWLLQNKGADLSKILVLQATQNNKKLLWVLNELLDSCLFEMIACDISHLHLKDFQLLQLKRQLRKQQTALVLLKESHQQLNSHPFYSLILRFEQQHLIVQRALHRPTPKIIHRRHSYADFMPQLESERSRLSRRKLSLIES